LESVLEPLNQVCFKCAACKKILIISSFRYLDRLKNSSRKKLFCSPRCSLLDRAQNLQTRQLISQAQKGISVLSRGRPGHIVSDETREKIRNTKLGKKRGKYDFALVRQELALEGVQRYFVTYPIIPDAIIVEGTNVIALEIQKVRWENDAKKKFANYDNNPNHGYDEVRIVWYNRASVRMKVWVWKKETREWSLFWQRSRE
jgi:hypothetical protein